MSDKEEHAKLKQEVMQNIPHEAQWSRMTGVFLGAFMFLWMLSFIDILPTDYNITFFVLSVLTGFYFFVEKFYWKKYLKKDSQGEWVRPWWLNWTSALFPVVLTVFLIRGFVGEPYRVPTGSMIPNIMIGEITLTNKLYYGITIPVLEKKLVTFASPKRGDVVVFRYPPNPMVYYVKRFVGLPGDTINYNFAAKRLTINSTVVQREKVNEFSAQGKTVEEYKEHLFGVDHTIWLEPAQKMVIQPEIDFEHEDACHYTQEDLTCVVPKGYYFAMGDNRDNSADSRYWGFVPEQNIVGRAQFIVFSPISLSRIGKIK